MDRHYYVYIMASHSGTLYKGMTNNLARRCAEHQRGEGSQFTSRYRVDRLVYYECFRYVANAIAREKRIKGWRRSKKVALFEKVNPSWRDLSRDFGKQFVPGDVLLKRHDAALDDRLFGGDRDSSLRSE